MGRKNFTAEQIIFKLREVEVLVGQGESIAMACRKIAVTEQTYYRWRKEYGGMGTDQLKRLKELEKENARLRRAVADLSLEKIMVLPGFPWVTPVRNWPGRGLDRHRRSRWLS